MLKIAKRGRVPAIGIGLFIAFCVVFLAERAELACAPAVSREAHCTLTSARLIGDKVTPLVLRGAEVVYASDHENTPFEFVVLHTPAGNLQFLTWQQASTGGRHDGDVTLIRAFLAAPAGLPLSVVQDNRNYVYGLAAFLAILALWALFALD